MLLRLLCLLLPGLFALPSCSNGLDSGEVWRFALEEPAGSVQDAYAQEFKRRVEERTAGEVRVRVFPLGTLGTSDDLTEQVSMGSLQFAMASPGHLGKTIPAVQAFLLHFLFSEHEEVNRRALADPAVRDTLLPLFREKNLHLLASFSEGWMVWNTRKAIRRPSDFAGVKFRTMTSPLLLQTYEAYGASPQALPYAEVYGGLQLNMIDAQENPIFAIEEMSFYEVTSHLIDARHAPFVATVVANPRFYDDLSAEHRRMVDEIVVELDPFVFEVQRKANRERREAILERKPEMVAIQLSEEERAAFRSLSLPVRRTFLDDAGPAGRTVLSTLLDAVDRHIRATAAESTE